MYIMALRAYTNHKEVYVGTANTVKHDNLHLLVPLKIVELCLEWLTDDCMKWTTSSTCWQVGGPASRGSCADALLSQDA